LVLHWFLENSDFNPWLKSSIPDDKSATRGDNQYQSTRSLENSVRNILHLIRLKRMDPAGVVC
jgi:hypothetical protein